MYNLTQLAELFHSHGTSFSVGRGDTILNQGDSLENVLLIQEGLVKITNSDKFGHGRTVTIFGKNHILPLSWLFIEPPEKGALYNHTALSNVVVESLPRHMIHKLLDENPHIYKTLLDITAKAYVNASYRIHNLQKTNVPEKVEFVLHYLATLFNETPDDPVAVINASLTHQDIADIAGLSRESVTHLFLKPKYRRIYWKKGGKTFINTTKLDTATLPQILPINM